MATHKLGKLKFNLSRQGLAYKWGDGEVHRLGFGRKNPPTENEYDSYEEYTEDDGYSEVGFDDRDTQVFDEPLYDEGYDGDGGMVNDDYDENYPAAAEAMKNAGIDKLVEEYNRQLAEYMALNAK